jgi:hypothetical protein
MSDTNIIDIDIIGDYNKYYCKISKSSIIFKLTKDTIILYDTEFIWTYPKLILNLIKYAFNNITENYENIKYYTYTIPVSELEFIDKTKFTQKYINDNINDDINDNINDDINGETVELTCDINDAFENFISGFMN